MLNGYDAGRSAARVGHDRAVSAGMPPRRPIYFALDTDPRSLSAAQWALVQSFCNGAASVLGRSRIGVYGGYAAIARLVPTYAAWGWQTYAWSGGRWSAKAHLRQYLNGQNLCGGEVDLCRSVTDDYGQWPIQEDDVTPEEHEWLRQVRASLVPQAEVNDGRFQVRTHIQTELVQNNGRLRNIIRQELAAEPNVDAAAVAARVLAVLTPEAIAAAIPDTLAADVANELHQRLAD